MVKGRPSDALCRLTATQAHHAICRGRLTARALMESCLSRISQFEPMVKAWDFFDSERALREADAIDERVRTGCDIGPLGGIPVGVKDIFNTVDMPTAMGSSIRQGFTPGNDARAVFALRQAGAIIPGKNVTSEFAVHFPGPTTNPHDLLRTPGTSSSGTVAAVAAGMVPVGIGSQTAGSAVRPASYCGIYGFKPTFGLIPRTGMLKTADTLDHVACFARSLEDVRLLFDVLRVRGWNYPYVHRVLPEVIDLSPEPPAKRSRWRIGLVRGGVWVWNHATPYGRQAVDELAATLGRHGCDVEEARLPDWINRVYEVHDLIYCKSLSYYFKEAYRDHRDHLSETLRHMIEQGQRMSLAQYQAALTEQALMATELASVFDHHDVLLALSSAGESPGSEDNVRMDTCAIWSLCGMPALNVPLFKGPSRLPFGVQVVSRRYQDAVVLRCAKMLTQVLARDDVVEPVTVSPPPGPMDVQPVTQTVSA